MLTIEPNWQEDPRQTPRPRKGKRALEAKPRSPYKYRGKDSITAREAMQWMLLWR